MNNKVLVINDEQNLLDIIAVILQGKGYAIVKSLKGDILAQVGTYVQRGFKQ
jgi:hypothetical protein